MAGELNGLLVSAKIRIVEEEIETLEQEADWLAMQLASRETPGHPELERKLYDKKEAWRDAARKTVPRRNDDGK